MAEKYSFFNAVMDSYGNYDREYLAEDFANYFASFIGNGVYAEPASNLKINALGGFKVAVSAGKAWVNGYFYENTAEKTFNIDVESAEGKVRIDSIVLRLDLTNRKLTTELKKGSASARPTPPALTRSTNIYELCLGDIAVAGGASSIAQANITDCRYTSNCGVVAGVVDQIDTEGLFNQYSDAFYTWFKEVEGILSTSAAGNLYNQIEVERKRVDTLVAQKGDEVTTETELAFVGGSYCTCGQIKIISNGISAEVYLPALKWTSGSYGFWHSIAELPDSLKPLTQSKSGTTIRQIIFESDDIQVGLRENAIQVKCNGGSTTYHNLMLSYALKNPVVPELQDIRVGLEGEVYASAGEAVRRQIEKFSVVHPLVLDANNAELYDTEPQYGDEALEAILEGRQILVRTPNADGKQYTAIYSPIYMYQLPNKDSDYLYIFYLRDEKQEIDLSMMGMGKIEMPVYGQLQMKLSKLYPSNPMEQ